MKLYKNAAALRQVIIMSEKTIVLRTKKAIKQALVDLMMQKPFDKIKTTEIIDLSGYSRGTFYTHYTDKYDLANELIRDEINTLVDIFLGTVKRKKKIIIGEILYEPALSFFEHVYEHRDLYHLILTSQIPGHTLDSFCEEAIKCFETQLDVAAEKGWPEPLDRHFLYFIKTYENLIFIKYLEKINYSISPLEMAKQVTALAEQNRINILKIKEESPDKKQVSPEDLS